MYRFMKGTKKRQWRWLPVLLLSITLLAFQSSRTVFAVELDSAEYAAMQYSAQEETEHSAESETSAVQDTGPETEEGFADELLSDESAQEETEHSAESETITGKDTGPETEERLTDGLPLDEPEDDLDMGTDTEWVDQAPTSDSEAETKEGTEQETDGETEGAAESTENSFYEKLMACGTLSEILNLLGSEGEPSSLLAETELNDFADYVHNKLDNGGWPDDNAESIVDSIMAILFGNSNYDAKIMAIADNNGYGDVNPDASFILIGKKIVGITAEQIPETFQITVTPQEGGTSYILNADNALSKGGDGLSWQWRIDNVGAGMYNVMETGYAIDGYSVRKAFNGADASDGTGTVEVKAADFTVNYVKYTTCNHTNWPVQIDGDSNVMFAAALTTGGCVVVSRYSLTESQRLTVAGEVTKIGGNWKAPVHFYSIENNGNGPWSIGGKELRYNPDTQEIILQNTSVWSHVALVNYSITEASNPDIDIINTYTAQTKPVIIEKIVTGNMGIRDREFTFTVSATGADGEPWIIDPYVQNQGSPYTVNTDGTITFTLSHEESVILQNAPIGGTLTITEGDEGAAGYTVSATADGTPLIESDVDNTFIYEVLSTDGQKITVENGKDAIPDTGIALASLPYILILVIVIVGGMIAFLKGRRNHDDD